MVEWSFRQKEKETQNGNSNMCLLLWKARMYPLIANKFY